MSCCQRIVVSLWGRLRLRWLLCTAFPEHQHGYKQNREYPANICQGTKNIQFLFVFLSRYLSSACWRGLNTQHLTKALCLSTSPNLAERDARILLKSLVLHKIGVVLLRGSIVTAGLSSLPNSRKWNQGIFFHFAAWKSSDSSCKAEVSHLSVHTTPYTNYPMMSLQSHVVFHYDHWLKFFPFHFLFYAYSSACWLSG